jgi:beta-glucosidase-like glycosyl hydrolase
MSAYLDPNDVPAGGNGFLLREVLRHDLGFKGFVFSGATAVRRTPLFAPCPPA